MKILYITTLARSRFGSFVKSAIYAAQSVGAEFHIASNETGIDQSIKDAECKELGIYHHHIDINREPTAFAQNKKAYEQIIELMQTHRFDAVHCNTPMGGFLGRLCAKKAKIPYVIYQAHGFHFWTGAPKKNWIIYYPVERLLARYTDLLITINREDYARAQKFQLRKGGKLTFVHGVGVDAEKVECIAVDKAAKRAQLGIPEDAIVFVTAGELNQNKNQTTAIEAFAQAEIPNAYFVICGEGEKKEDLEKLICKRNMENKIILAGFRRDMFEILKASDIFVLPSFREGLPGALMEAMAAGLPCMASRIRGNVDLLGRNYPYLFVADDSMDLCKKMQKLTGECKQWGDYCAEQIRPYTLPVVVEELKHIYERIG